MAKQATSKPLKAVIEQGKPVIHPSDEQIAAILSHADDVIGRVVNKAVSGKGLRQASGKARSTRAPHLSTIERELSEIKRVVEALAVRSIAQKHQVQFLNGAAITVLDAEVAYRILDNPPEPNEALRYLLQLR